MFRKISNFERLKGGLKIMKGKVLMTFLLAVFLVMTIGFASADTTTLYPTDDSYVNEAGGDNNYGSDYSLRVESDNSNTQRTFLKFDLSSIPTGSTINSATLYLYQYKAAGDSIRAYEIRKISNTWSESTITWNNQPGYFGVTSTTNVNTNDGWKSWDVASDVAAFVSGATNNGWVIKDETEAGNHNRRFISKEYDSLDPYLVIDYTPADNIDPDTDIGYITRDNYDTDPHQCVQWDNYYVTWTTYNEDIVTHGISKDDDSGVRVSTNSPQYVWDTILNSWQMVNPDGNAEDGDLQVPWYSPFYAWTDGILSEGHHRVCGRARDLDGNQENPVIGVINVWSLPDDDCCDVCIDKETPPVTTKEVSEPKEPKSADENFYVTNETDFTLTCTDTCAENEDAGYTIPGSGCKETKYKVKFCGANENCCLESTQGTWDDWITYELLSFHLGTEDGYYCLQWYSVDNANNKETDNYQEHKLDNIPPEASKLVGEPKYPYDVEVPTGYDAESWYVSPQQTEFTFSCVDSEVGATEVCYMIGYTITCNDLVDGSYTTTFDYLPHGEFNISYWCIDALGNSGQGSSYQKYERDFMERIPPEIQILNPDSPIGCAMLTFDVIAIVTDADSGVQTVEARLVNSAPQGVVYDWTAMESIGNDKYRVAFSNLIDAGNYNVEVRAFDNVENQNTVPKSVDFYQDVYFETAPESCTVDWTEGGQCNFEYQMTLCHGGDEVAMTMHKLCCLTWLNPTLSNGVDTVFVEELFKLPTFWYAINVYVEQFTDWCSSDTNTLWGDYITLRNWNEETRTGYVTLNFEVPELDSCGMCDKIYYAIDYQDKPQFYSYPRVSYFGIECDGDNIIFNPKGPTYYECGNGIKENGEQCDFEGTRTCESIYDSANSGYHWEGSASCSETCTLSGCTQVANPAQAASGGGGGGGGSAMNSQTPLSGGETADCSVTNTCNLGEDVKEELSVVEPKITSTDEEGNDKTPVTGSFLGLSQGAKKAMIGGLIFLAIVGITLLITTAAKKKKSKFSF